MPHRPSTWIKWFSYENRLPGLGADYLAEFESLMVRVCNNPNTFPLIEQTQIRKASMRRFPFHVMYMVHEAQIHILAIAHQRRQPRAHRPLKQHLYGYSHA